MRSAIRILGSALVALFLLALPAAAADVGFDSGPLSVVTADGKLSAQFEHTVGVTEDGCEIFTRSPAGRDNPLAPR